MPQSKDFYNGMIKKRIIIKQPTDIVWKKISKIAQLDWLRDVIKTELLSKKKQGPGSSRKIFFKDKSIVEEHIVGWKTGQYFSYIAVSGLPLRAYHATISLKPVKKNSTQVSWESYFNTKLMTGSEFHEFEEFLGKFYQDSLKNLKNMLEA